MNLNKRLLNKIIASKNLTPEKLNKLKRHFADKSKTGMISNAALLKLHRKNIQGKSVDHFANHIDHVVSNLLMKRRIRTLSGVAPIAVLTKPFPCPGKCAYCPTEKAMPKSYLSNEPAVMRAILTKFDPFVQVRTRIDALENNGHDTDKIELIIMGGTWSCLPKSYQTEFVKNCFESCNLNSISEALNSKQIKNSKKNKNKKIKTLKEVQRENETAKRRIVAMTIETRPDYVDEKQIKHWRTLGATKVELGVQTLDDQIFKLNKRGHGVAEVIRATKLLKQAGFKIAYHMMPNLPGSTPKKDLDIYKKLFNDQDFQPDFIKIYPTVVTKNAELYKWWQAGKYKPYSAKQLLALLIKMKLATPEYVRIIRLIRDIPAESIVAGNKISNLRQILQAQVKQLTLSGVEGCKCIRCREARENSTGMNAAKLFVDKYQASGADEYFLQFASKDKFKLFAFLRLRIPNKKEINFIPEIKNCAMIREIHTYGALVSLNKNKKSKAIQHQGFGIKLTIKAEQIAKQCGFKKIAVIAGVGVRNYYRKLGYESSGTYLVKNL
ncbi:MAG: tRNA uridine(34) 5-carboxymethylaminomethyl modification radical SAM/GNAT enzyme Elp3 [Parcubacteria group bacterium]